MIGFFKNKILQRPNQMIPYSEFIADALYHEELGYYMKESEKVGRKGDFITTSNISDVYGRLLAKWFLKLMKEYDLPPVVCELGAGTGRFAAAFIDEWKKQTDEILEYWIVEASPYHRKLQQELISFDGQIRQVQALEEVPPFRGFVFSNELFDALPVHVIEKHDGKLKEVMVSIEGNKLIEKVVPLENEEILAFLSDSNITLNEKQRVEIPLAMEEVIRQISETLIEGVVVTVDYGYRDEEWMEPVHKKGSLRGYFKHEMFADVLQHPGQMDITTHVHLDALIRLGKKYQLEDVSLKRQDEFFLSIGILEELQEHIDPNPFSDISRRNRAIKSLILPSGMSSFFHVLVQRK